MNDSAAPKKCDPRPVRFDQTEDEMLRTLSRKTGLGLGELIRRAGKFVFPRFLSGEVNIAELTQATPEKETPVTRRSRK